MEFDPEQTLQPSQSPTGSSGKLPEKIGRYRIERHLGDGGMGRVYLARHPGMDRRDALKLLPRAANRHPDDVRRFRTEARTLAKLDHPHIVRVYDFDEAEGECFLGMEFVDGGDLLDKIKASPEGMPPDEAHRILEQLLESLVYAHGKGVIHRDLKPANLLLTQDGTIKVSDFGLAAVVGEDYQKSLIEKSITLSRVANMETMQLEEGSSASAFAGTLLYMSPEAIQGGRPDKRDDLYAVGVIAYYMLTGKQPGVNYKPPSKLVKGVGRRWDHFIVNCLETADQRFQTAEETLAALRQINRKRRAAPLVLAVFLLVAAGLGAATWQWEAVRPYLDEARGTVEGWLAAEPTTPDTVEPDRPGAPTTTVPTALAPGERALVVRGSPRAVSLRARAGRETVYESPLDLPASVNLPQDRGRLTLEFSAPGYAAESVVLDPAEGLESLAIQLAPLVAERTFRFRSNVSAAEVWVRGEALGTTLAPIAVTFRRDSKNASWAPVEAIVRAPGFEPVTQQVGFEDPELLPVVNLTPRSEDMVVTLPDGARITFKPIEPGSFMMGSPETEVGHKFDENQRRVTIADQFFIGATEVTQAQYRAVMGRNPSSNRFGNAGDRPVEQITFADIVAPGGFLDRFNAYLAARGYEGWQAALPSEEQWEYAARAGTTSALSNGADLRDTQRDGALARVAHYSANATIPVASLEANPWGLYDVHGNVWEWTSNGVLRGGSFLEGATSSRSASRLRGFGESSRTDKRFGFRLILLRER
ncbi:MAG: protein kinase domain-containing protein [Verrucomicrobiota bacterium]